MELEQKILQMMACLLSRQDEMEARASEKVGCQGRCLSRENVGLFGRIEILRERDDSLSSSVRGLSREFKGQAQTNGDL
jgi:hypothetical protein